MARTKVKPASAGSAEPVMPSTGGASGDKPARGGRPRVGGELAEKGERSPRINVAVPVAIDAALDQLVSEGEAATRSEAARMALATALAPARRKLMRAIDGLDDGEIEALAESLAAVRESRSAAAAAARRRLREVDRLDDQDVDTVVASITTARR